MTDSAGRDVRLLVEFVAATASDVARMVPRGGRGGIETLVARSAVERCITRYQAIGLLIGQWLPDEALILLRPLLTDSQRLQYVDSRPSVDRPGLLLRWFDHGVQDLDGQARKAAAVGQPGSDLAIYASSTSEHVGALRATLAERRQRLGVQRLGRYPAEGDNMARALRQFEDAFDYTIASASAHHSMSSSFRHYEMRGQTVRIRARNRDLNLARTIVERATRHTLRAAVAAGRILSWPQTAELEAYQDRVGGAMDADELPPR